MRRNTKVLVEFRGKETRNSVPMDSRLFDNEQEAQSFIWQHRDVAIYGLDARGEPEVVDIHRGDWEWMRQRVWEMPS